MGSCPSLFCCFALILLVGSPGWVVYCFFIPQFIWIVGVSRNYHRSSIWGKLAWECKIWELVLACRFWCMDLTVQHCSTTPDLCIGYLIEKFNESSFACNSFSLGDGKLLRHEIENPQIFFGKSISYFLIPQNNRKVWAFCCWPGAPYFRFSQG